MAAPPVPAAGGVCPPDGEVDARLRQVLPLVRMRGTPLAEAIDRLREQTGANLLVDWGRLREINVDRKTPVEVDLHDVSFARALHYLLASVGNPAGRADWGLDDGIIVVTTADVTTGMTEVRVYDVRDLIGPSPPVRTRPARAGPFPRRARNRSNGLLESLRPTWTPTVGKTTAARAAAFTN